MKYIIAMVALLVIGAILFLQLSKSPENLPIEDSELVLAINRCEAITEKAASHLIAVVEFQKLEIVGRKANVFRTCMKDHGYIENPVWLKYFISTAQHTAKISNISENEAIENLRRAKMVVYSSTQKEPLYWVKALVDN